MTPRFFAGLFLVVLLPSAAMAAQIGILERVSPLPTTYVLGLSGDFLPVLNSALGDVTAVLQAVDLELPPNATPNTSTSGCDATDFAGFIAGRIALMQRGTCTLEIKTANAFAAGAIGALIFNEGQPGRIGVFPGLSQNPTGIPVVSTSFAVGDILASLIATAGPVTIHLQVTDSSVDVPEPATLALVGLGLGTAALRRRRQR